MDVEIKPTVWLGTSRDDVRAMRDDIKSELGRQLFLVQTGGNPSSCKPMPTVGSGVYEIRVSDRDGIARLMYVAKFGETVYVLHAFNKNTQKTSKSDIELAKRRYKEIPK